MVHPLTPSNYDGVVSALTGNGELCTTLSPTGYHVPLDQAQDIAHRTQYFVMAGRRLAGPHHRLVNYGTISRELLIDGAPPTVRDWRQEIDFASGAVLSTWQHEGVSETTRSCVALGNNLFLADTVLANTGDSVLEVRFAVGYRFGEDSAGLAIHRANESVRIAFEIEEHLGDILFVVNAAEEAISQTEICTNRATVVVASSLKPGESLVVTSCLLFSDRVHYEFPIDSAGIDAAAEAHEAGWREFWSRSEVQTGDDLVDSFRKASLYTLRCQMTPWSIGPTLSETYWGGGAFHDELYPFFALLSSNHPELAARIPYFRLTTLPQAMARARGRGALYPWSSTEYGEERDPNGLWLTERFHLGQFAACIHALWLTERERIQLDDLYLVLRELARYFELEMVQHDEAGELRMRACVDFDESVGAVMNGPFTVCAAVAALEYAAQAAEELGRDFERIPRWRSVAAQLREILPRAETTYAIPDSKPLHSSILGPVFPFRLDVGSSLAQASAAHIHDVCRSARGWKPGTSDVFAGSSWMWTAGHLATVHALLGEADASWDAIRGGPMSAGPLLCPNEHVTGEDIIQVPWFTTGCGAWLYGLNALFMQIDERGTKLVPAVPAALPNAKFRDLRGESGVLISGRFEAGRLVSLSARASQSMTWRFRIPAQYSEQLAVGALPDGDGWVAVGAVELSEGENSLLRF